MTVIRFTVHMPAVGKARPRVVRQGGKAHAFTPKKTRDFERLVALLARGAVASVPGWRRDAQYGLGVRVLDGGVEVTVVQRSRTIKRASRFDLDNVVKAVADALNGVAWDDDRQVVSMQIEDAGK